MKHNRTLRRGLSILLSLLLCLSLLPAAALAETETSVAINETNFPDETFRSIVSGYDTDGDGTLSAEEIAAVTSIDCCYSGISDLTGIEHFTALTYLDCSDNQLSTLDVSSNTALEYLDCSDNQLSTLDVSNNEALTQLHCYCNQLSTLDVSSNKALTILLCYGNQLATLDVSNNKALEYLECSSNQLSTLKLVNNTSLTGLYCSNNQLTTLDVSSNTALKELYCGSNYLQSLDVSKNESLNDLGCGSNYLQSLDVSNNKALTYLKCSSNYLSELDVSKNESLQYLYCGENYLAALDVSGNEYLKYLDAKYNTYPVRLSEGRTFDLSTLPGGFDLSKASNWSGGTVNGTILTFAPDVTEVTYTYDCGYECSVTFTLKPGYTVTAYGLYGADMELEPGETYVDDYIAGDWVALQVGKRDGYTMEGLTLSGITEEDILLWIDGDAESAYRGIFFEMPDHDVTITVNWKEVKYTVTFDPNGGELITASHPSTETEPDGTVDYLAVATREGYTFDGWYTEPVGGEKVHTFITVFTADTTVYAHWTPVAQTKQITQASFAMKGYTVGANAEDIVVTSYTEGLSLIGGYFEALGKPYSYLLGTDEDEDGEVDTVVTGPLEANKTYILMLKADVNAGYDVSGLTKDHVTLNGDITAEECGENKWEASIGCSFVLPVLTENDTAPAKNTVTVNGSYASATGAGEYEEGDLVTLAAGSRSGYTFRGWTVVSGGVTLTDANSASTTFIMPANDVTVTANWTQESTGDNTGDDSGGGSDSGNTDNGSSGGGSDSNTDNGSTGGSNTDNGSTSGGGSNTDNGSTGGGSNTGDKPDSGNPQTGDTAMPMVFGGVAILALAAMVVLFAMKKRQSCEG